MQSKFLIFFLQINIFSFLFFFRDKNQLNTSLTAKIAAEEKNDNKNDFIVGCT